MRGIEETFKTKLRKHLENRKFASLFFESIRNGVLSEESITALRIFDWTLLNWSELQRPQEDEKRLPYTIDDYLSPDSLEFKSEIKSVVDWATSINFPISVIWQWILEIQKEIETS